MTTTFNKFETVLKNKLGEIQTQDTFAGGNFDAILSSAVPIWTILAMTEEEYNAKYCPDSPPDETDASGNNADLSAEYESRESQNAFLAEVCVDKT